MNALVRSSLPLAIVAAALAVPAADAPAQQDHNIVHRNNVNWLWVGGRHSNGHRYLPRTVSPRAYWDQTSKKGVAKGTHTWRWIPAAQNMRKEAREVSGLVLGMRPSAATTQFPLTGYFPEIKFLHVKARAGGGMDPDFSKPPLLKVAKSSHTFASFGAFTVRRTMMTPVKITTDDVMLALMWEGGEHQDVPNKQAFWASSRESEYKPMTWGFADPSNKLTYGTRQDRFHRFTYMEEQASITGQSDWGQSRRVNRQPPLRGWGLGTGQSDVAARSGQIAWDVHAGTSQAARSAVPLMNIGPIFPASFNLLGVTLEVNIADANLGLLAGSGYVLRLDNNGFGDGPFLQLPALGSAAIGTNIGVEFVIVDQSAGKVVESTQAYWTTITR